MSAQSGANAQLARRVRMIIIDVDGVMTDGGIYTGVTASGETLELKRFEITDGLGVKMLTRAGLFVYVVSGRHSDANRVRAIELEVEYREAHGGFKLQVVEQLRQQHGLLWDEVCCIGDDLADLPIVKCSGLSVAVANAVPEVKAASKWHTKRAGGNGAVRELAESILRARGEWDALVEEYLRERS